MCVSVSNYTAYDEKAFSLMFSESTLFYVFYVHQTIRLYGIAACYFFLSFFAQVCLTSKKRAPPCASRLGPKQIFAPLALNNYECYYLGYGTPTKEIMYNLKFANGQVKLPDVPTQTTAHAQVSEFMSYQLCSYFFVYQALTVIFCHYDG